eukprot:5344793-Amphidinium_carterae.1
MQAKKKGRKAKGLVPLAQFDQLRVGFGARVRLAWYDVATTWEAGRAKLVNTAADEQTECARRENGFKQMTHQEDLLTLCCNFGVQEV